VFVGNSGAIGKGNVERAVAYLRVGRREHADGHGLDSQRERVADYAHRKGIWLMAVYEDRGVSGSTPLAARPGMSEAFDVVRASAADILLVARRDRIAPDPLVGALIEREFEQAGGRVVYAEDGMEDRSQNQPMREVLDSVAEYERASLVARLTAARAAKKARGGYAGGRPPFGYRAHGKALVPNEEQAAVVRRIFDRVARDGWSTRAIAEELDQEGVLGRRWRSPDVWTILRREDYKKGAPSTRIIDARVWNRADAVLAARRRRRPPDP
jgi:DNA invertase Pin-like site-specific DNA recombinase